MPQSEYALIHNPDAVLLDELRQRGYQISTAYMGDLGYTTSDQTADVCDAINDLMRDTVDWNPINWETLTPYVHRRLMHLAADSDTFMEKGRLPSGFDYEEDINCILDLSHDHTSSHVTDTNLPPDWARTDSCDYRLS